MATINLGHALSANIMSRFERDVLSPLSPSNPIQTFAGMPIHESSIFPFQSVCKTCEGTGEGVESTYCKACKGAGETRIEGTMTSGGGIFDPLPTKMVLITSPLPRKFDPYVTFSVAGPPLSRGLA